MCIKLLERQTSLARCIKHFPPLSPFRGRGKGQGEEAENSLRWTDTLKDNIRLLVQGGPGFVQIALTNACNARCRFCGFPQLKPADRVMADPERLRRGLHTLAAHRVRFIVFTGGEPLLYPYLLDILGAAQDNGIQSLLCTNGGRWPDEQQSRVRRQCRREEGVRKIPSYSIPAFRICSHI